MKNLEPHILNISKFHYHNFLNLPNVNGVGFGFKYINDKCTYEPCIHVLVSEKIHKSNLSYDKLIPKYFMGVKTDVIKSGIIKSHSFLRKKSRPLKGGFEIFVDAPNDSSYGTIGCIVSKGTILKSYYILSCNHVLADGNMFPKNTPIIQPPDGDRNNDIVAKLSNWIKINFITANEEPENKMDCAIAKLINYKDASKKIALLGKIKGVGTPKLHLKVKKVGTTTALTTGKITTIGATTISSFSENRNALFVDQIATTPMAAAGDSGSLLLDSNNNAIGLLMAGSDSMTIFNDITLVLNALNVKLI